MYCLLCVPIFSLQLRAEATCSILRLDSWFPQSQEKRLHSEAVKKHHKTGVLILSVSPRWGKVPRLCGSLEPQVSRKVSLLGTSG